MFIQTQNLMKTYGNTTALHDINIAISNGITALLGPNGAGKSTLFRIIAGLEKPKSGNVRVMEADPYLSHSTIAADMGVVLERDGHLENTGALKQISLFAKMQGVSQNIAKDYAQAALVKVELNEVADNAVKTYSKGMRKRLSIARAIVHNPKILLLDEPTEGLDPNQVINLRELLEDMKNQGMCIFLNTHNLSEVAQAADKIIVIDRGKVLFDDSIDAFLDVVPSSEDKSVRVEKAYQKVLKTST